jgi:hypothetical protein
VALPTAYLTTTKNLGSILQAIQGAEAPPKFNRKFLETLGFRSSGDRLIIPVLKAIGFLNGDGSPTERYVRYLDKSQAPRVLAEGLREGYTDLFQIDRQAQRMSQADLKNKIKTLRNGKGSDTVLNAMAKTFLALAELSDFEAAPERKPAAPEAEPERVAEPAPGREEIALGGLVYNINLELPESRDPAVYDALFESLRAHLLR